jgi:serine/threonine protein kinase
MQDGGLVPAEVDQGSMIAGRYRLVERLGSGGVGTVWRAFDEQLHRDVAVKELHLPPGLAARQQSEALQAALAEARHAARLNHPRIVGVYEVVAQNSRPYIVMPYVPGQSLRATVEAQGPLSPERTAVLAGQLLDAIAAAHAAGIIHRDIKPSNVLVTDTGDALLTDFSLAEAVGAGTISRSGHMVGTPGYIAPERVVAGRVGVEADLFGLGATLFYAVEGRAAFEHADPVAGAFSTAVHPHPRPVRAGGLTPLIDALLEKDPHDRASLASARALLAASGLATATATDPGLAGSGAVAEADDATTATDDQWEPTGLDTMRPDLLAAQNLARTLAPSPEPASMPPAPGSTPTTPASTLRASTWTPPVPTERAEPAGLRAIVGRIGRREGVRVRSRIVVTVTAALVILVVSALAVAQSLASPDGSSAGARAPGTGGAGSGNPPAGAVASDSASGSASPGSTLSPTSSQDGTSTGSEGPNPKGPGHSPITGPVLVTAALRVVQNGANSATANVNGSTVTGGATIASYTLTWGDGSATTTFSSGSTASHPYQHSGTYPVTLVVAADTGATGSTSAQLTVTIAPPHVDAYFSSNANLAAVLDLSGSTPGGWPIATYQITWGDGTTLTSSFNTPPTHMITHRYPRCPAAGPPTYTVLVTLTDTYGNSGSSGTSVDLACIGGCPIVGSIIVGTIGVNGDEPAYGRIPDITTC